MPQNNPFKFKEFTLNQDKCAMKIGTDGVLLGVWVSIHQEPQTILDIGTGTGLIALQLAQRSDAEQVDAIEINEDAYEQAVENFEGSIWNDRLFCYHCSLGDFVDEMDEKYHLIVSNPPFYADDFQTENKARNQARFTSSLSFESLINGVSTLLDSAGIFALVIPIKEKENLIRLASSKGLFLKRICKVRGKVGSSFKRVLMEFTFAELDIIEEELTIEKERHDYTTAYIDLVKDFYLKM